MNLVEKLKADELASLQSDWDNDRRSHALKVLNERGSAQALVADEYTGRYPFELLQNAADAATSAKRVGRVLFELTDTALLVADNGTGFGEDQINGICTLAGSPKDPDESIGYKGLGFKSVAEITDRPQVLTRDISFEFDTDRTYKVVEAITGPLLPGLPLPTYALPFIIGPDDPLEGDRARVDELLSDWASTVMRLPLSAGVELASVEKHLLETVQPQVLLFLTSLERLEVKVGGAGNFTAVSVRESAGACEAVLLQADQRTTEWRVYRRKLTPRRALLDPLGDAWKSVENVGVAVAVPVRLDGSQDTAMTYPLHAYFPTDEQGPFAFIVHADWSLQLDRRALSSTAATLPYNAFLTAAVVDLICDVVLPDLPEQFVDRPCTPAQLVTPRSSASGVAARVLAGLIERLREIRFIAAVGGTLLRPVDVMALPGTCPDVAWTHAMVDLAAHPYLVAPELELDAATREFLVDQLQVRELQLYEGLGALKPPTPDTADGYYKHLLAWDEEAGRGKFKLALANVKCVLTAQGNALRTKDRVFFPRRNDQFTLPPQLVVPVAALPAIDGLAALLREANLKDFEPRQIVLEWLIPLLRDPEADTELRGLALGALRGYFASTKRGGDQGVLAAVGQVLLPARTADRRSTSLARADAVYLPATWTRTPHLEEIYGPFGIAEFLDVEPPADAQERDAELEFLRFLGVADLPRALKEGSTGIPGRPHSADALWSRWWADERTHAAAKCPQGHPYSQHVSVSYVLDRFSDLVAASDGTRLSRLWMVLASRWEIYEPAMVAEMQCVHSSMHPGRRRSTPSAFAFGLETAAWVPAHVDGEARLVAPLQAWRAGTEVRSKAIRARLPLVADGLVGNSAGAKLADLLGVVDAAHPQASRVVDLLHQLAVEADEGAEASGVVPDDVMEAAQWAVERLEQVLTGGRRGEGRDIRLPAQVGGRAALVAGPLQVVNALLRETWQRTDQPLLAVDTEVPKVAAYADVLSLDELVDPQPNPKRPRADRDRAVRAYIWHVAAWMLTLVPPGRRWKDFAGRLDRLDVRACDELVMKYVYGTTALERPEAVCHIASEIIGTGPRSYARGTAHIELDDDAEPYWYELGPELARYLEAPSLGDVFASLLAAGGLRGSARARGDRERDRIVGAKRVASQDIEGARLHLRKRRQTEEFDEVRGADMFDWDLPAPPPVKTGPPVPGSPPPPALPSPPVNPTVPPTAGLPSPPIPPKPLPDLDLDDIEIEIPDPGPAPAKQPANGGRGTGGGGGGVPSPTDAVELGLRGETFAIAAEKQRIAKLGLDPEQHVEWTSKENPMSPYDIRSVIDATGVSLFIEVKATSSADPTEDFFISHAELQEALRLGDQYTLYRVTSTRESRPRLRRYGNPLEHVRNGTASWDPANVRMRFGTDAPHDQDG